MDPKRPKSLPSGVVFYDDESADPVAWIGGLAEMFAAAKDLKIRTEDLRNTAEHNAHLAFHALERTGDIVPGTTFDEWWPTVLSLFPDQDTATDPVVIAEALNIAAERLTDGGMVADTLAGLISEAEVRILAAVAREAGLEAETDPEGEVAVPAGL